MSKEPDEPPEVLGCRGEEDFILHATQASKPKPVELEDALHVRKPHLHLFAFAP